MKEASVVEELRIELARESDAVEFERFVAELGLHPIRSGALVPTRLPDGGAALRPAAA